VFQAGADHGAASAMNFVGQFYRDGFGVAQDFAKAREWYEKAADKGAPGAKRFLLILPIYEAAAAGHYAEALQMEERLAAALEAAENKEKGRPGEATAIALQNVAWRALFAREFTKALTAADRARELLSEEDLFTFLSNETNRAHALMFLGRGEEARALYLAHKGKPLPGQHGRLWEGAIVQDFTKFRKAGLTHPMMAEIEKELGVSP
jgi:tetratricopeptide (TPR) repeat protein